MAPTSTAHSVAPAPLLPDSLNGVAVVAKFFRALADLTWLRLREFLLHDEHTVTECVAHIGLSRGRVSTDLSYLALCGYMQVRSGRHSFYAVADLRVADLTSTSAPKLASPWPLQGRSPRLNEKRHSRCSVVE
jgi:hypothetical protein